MGCEPGFEECLGFWGCMAVPRRVLGMQGAVWACMGQQGSYKEGSGDVAFEQRQT